MSTTHRIRTESNFQQWPQKEDTFPRRLSSSCIICAPGKGPIGMKSRMVESLHVKFSQLLTISLDVPVRQFQSEAKIRAVKLLIRNKINGHRFLYFPLEVLLQTRRSYTIPRLIWTTNQLQMLRCKQTWLLTSGRNRHLLGQGSLLKGANSNEVVPLVHQNKTSDQENLEQAICKTSIARIST